MIRFENVAVNDYEFHIRACGSQSGDLIILLHGFPETGYAFESMMPQLAQQGFFVIAPDQRGYSPGARPDSINEYEIEKLASDVVQLAKSYGYNHYHVVGHDWGGAVGWYLAANFPESVLSFCSLSTPYLNAFHEAMSQADADQAEKSKYIKDFVSMGFERQLLSDDAKGLMTIYHGVGANYVDQYLGVLGCEVALRSALNWYRANFNNQDKQLISSDEITVPSLYIWGRQDMAMSEWAAQRTAHYVHAPYQFVAIDHAGHWLPECNSQELLPMILNHTLRYSTKTSVA